MPPDDTACMLVALGLWDSRCRDDQSLCACTGPRGTEAHAHRMMSTGMKRQVSNKTVLAMKLDTTPSITNLQLV